MTAVDPSAEFDRQVENLLDADYPVEHAIEPLRERLSELPGANRGASVPFLVAAAPRLAPPGAAITSARLDGKTGFTDMDAEDLKRFAPIDGVNPPADALYLLTEVDAGPDTLNVTPDDALGMITNEGRSPLTIAEGLALVVHYPEILRDRNCFSLLGSRCGDRRITAIWISKGRPRLGWCWAGNPHTWLGSASCGGRIGVS